MINLLPTDIKNQMRYARRNVALLHWCMVMVCAIAGLATIAFFGQFYIANSEKNLRNTVSIINERVAREKLPDSQKAYESLSSGVKTIMQILSKQILFSQLMPKLAIALPDGAVVTGLTLTPNDVALDMQIATKDESTAAQAQINFADPKNQLFDKADIVSLACAQPGEATDTDPTSASDKYPCTVSLRVLYKKDASFLFLNSLEAKP